MPRVKVVAFTLDSVPLVAPVTVISLSASVVGSALKVRVSWVVVVVALPLAVRLVQLIAVVPLLGVTEFEAADAGLVPIAFVAVTVKVYAVPLVKPVTVMGLVVPVAVKLPGFDVTVNTVIALPPVLVGAVNDTVASPFPAVAVPIVGASGAVTGATDTAVFGVASQVVPPSTETRTV